MKRIAMLVLLAALAGCAAPQLPSCSDSGPWKPVNENKGSKA
jgi:hypothetical protein